MAVYEEGYGPDATQSRLSHVMNYAGAALSLALILGVGVWGYKLVVRDVSGIPVVRAMEGEMRVLPDNPGGAVALHTGLAVNEVAASGEAGGPEDVLLLAPTDAGLAQEDLVVELAPEAAQLPDAVAAPLDDTAALDVLEDGAAATSAEAAEVDEIALLTQMLAANPASLPEGTVTDSLPASVPGVRTSIRPIGRPAGLSTLQATPVSLTTDEVIVAATEFPPGTNLIHLGAYATPAEAAEAWTLLEGQMGQYLSGYGRVIQVSNQSGGTWYRLRASGFADRAEARRLCAVLQAENAECIAVVTP
ncbi:SPOR domain-containing protein [Yoonia sp.]|uniref:SPOR domain-containing protein n=1 Tax=Yoonia sp. TaxID=2212373 RepID=UPI002FD9643E